MQVEDCTWGVGSFALATTFEALQNIHTKPLSTLIPESEIQGQRFRRQSKHAAKYWQYFSPIFVHEFPGDKKFWSQRYAERIWGDFFFGPADFRKIAGEFLGEFGW